jgi:hypothetical protein
MSDTVHSTPSSPAERIAYQRALAANARRITDPRLRAEVEALAAGTMSPAEFVRFVDHSPTAWRGLRRTLSTYLALTDEQRTDLVEQYRRRTAAIQAELDQPPPAARPAGPPDEDEPWDSQQSWLE